MTKAKPEPGGMTRGKLFRLDKGWVFVTPLEVGAELATHFAEYWKTVTDEPLIVVPDTDLMIGEEGRLLVKEVAFAFPEPEVT